MYCLYEFSYKAAWKLFTAFQCHKKARKKKKKYTNYRWPLLPFSIRKCFLEKHKKERKLPCSHYPESLQPIYIACHHVADLNLKFNHSLS